MTITEMKQGRAGIMRFPPQRAQNARRGRRLLAVAILCLTALVAPASTVWAQQPPASTPDGFVPVENLGTQEKIPAAPLVIGAYAIAWIAVFGYLWSIWQRLSRVERELAEISRRVPTGGARR
jgi:CcmD family protein